jgi:hypothetical protein
MFAVTTMDFGILHALPFYLQLGLICAGIDFAAQRPWASVNWLSRVEGCPPRPHGRPTRARAGMDQARQTRARDGLFQNRWGGLRLRLLQQLLLGSYNQRLERFDRDA